jgi:FemAB-related protein (PEP-CTERM system-associated)
VTPNSSTREGDGVWHLPAGVTLEKHSLGDAPASGEWDRFVSAHPDATPFHLRAWLRCLCATYRHDASLFLLRDAGGEIAAVLPFVTVHFPFCRPRHVSLPFSDYGGILARDAAAADRLLDGLPRLVKGRRNRIEIRGAVPERPDWKVRNSYVRHTLDLRQGIDRLSKQLERRTIQYSIRKAERCGITIEDATSAEGINEFYRLNLLTREKHGVPSQPLRFFRGVMEGLGPGATPTILIARDGRTAVAAGLFIEFNGTVYFKYDASDPEFLTSKTPNHLLTWHAIRAAFERGLERFDFGRSSISNEGLCRYKKLWGASEEALPYSYCPGEAAPATVGETGTTYRLLTSIWRRLPASAQATIGPRVYKYLG